MFANFSESFSSRSYFFARTLIKSVNKNHYFFSAPCKAHSTPLCIAIVAKAKLCNYSYQSKVPGKKLFFSRAACSRGIPTVYCYSLLEQKLCNYSYIARHCVLLFANVQNPHISTHESSLSRHSPSSPFPLSSFPKHSPTRSQNRSRKRSQKRLPKRTPERSRRATREHLD